MKKEIEIIKLNHQADGIGKIDNKVIFVSKTLPEEKIEVKVIKEHKNYYEGKLLKILEKSNLRKEYLCPYYNECGGCKLGHISYEEELKFKREKVINIFKKYCNLDINPEIVGSNKKDKYRNKITLHVHNNKVALKEEASNNNINIDSCMLVSNKINNIIKTLNFCDLSKITKIVIKEADELMLIIYGNVKKIDIDNLKKYVSNIILYNNDSEYEIINGQDFITSSLGDYHFKISPSSFFQINYNQTINLYNYIKEKVEGNKGNLIDLYCGTGTIGIYLSKYFKKVIGIEINKEAISDANINKKINNVENIEFISGDVSKMINDKYYADTIIVDPPRKGLDKKTIDILKSIKPKMIVYVSCNPITLARDLNDFLLTYNIESIKLFDMFPRTHHVESVVTLKLSE